MKSFEVEQQLKNSSKGFVQHYLAKGYAALLYSKSKKRPFLYTDDCSLPFVYEKAQDAINHGRIEASMSTDTEFLCPIWMAVDREDKRDGRKGKCLGFDRVLFTAADVKKGIARNK